MQSIKSPSTPPVPSHHLYCEVSHGHAWRWIEVQTRSIKCFENYGYANFSGNLEGDTAEFDLNMAKSCSRWITFFDRCPLIWNSKLQTKNALLTTEAEYISYNHCAISYQSWICWRRWNLPDLKSSVPIHMSFVKHLKTILLHFNWLACQRSNHTMRPMRQWYLGLLLELLVLGLALELGLGSMHQPVIKNTNLFWHWYLFCYL